MYYHGEHGDQGNHAIIIRPQFSMRRKACAIAAAAAAAATAGHDGRDQCSEQCSGSSGLTHTVHGSETQGISDACTSCGSGTL